MLRSQRPRLRLRASAPAHSYPPAAAPADPSQLSSAQLALLRRHAATSAQLCTPDATLSRALPGLAPPARAALVLAGLGLGAIGALVAQAVLSDAVRNSAGGWVIGVLLAAVAAAAVEDSLGDHSDRVRLLGAASAASATLVAWAWVFDPSSWHQTAWVATAAAALVGFGALALSLGALSWGWRSRRHARRLASALSLSDEALGLLARLRRAHASMESSLETLEGSASPTASSNASDRVLFLEVLARARSEASLAVEAFSLAAQAEPDQAVRAGQVVRDRWEAFSGFERSLTEMLAGAERAAAALLLILREQEREREAIEAHRALEERRVAHDAQLARLLAHAPAPAPAPAALGASLSRLDELAASRTSAWASLRAQLHL